MLELRPLARIQTGDPITAFLVHGDSLFVGTASGHVSCWDIRSLSDATWAEMDEGSKVRDYSLWGEEGVRGLAVVGGKLFATFGDLRVRCWTLDSDDPPEIIDLDRRHNRTICTLSFTAQSGSTVVVLTQGQSLSHVLNLETGEQQGVTAMVCPWHTVPVDFDHRLRLLWREDLPGKSSFFGKRKLGDEKRLKVWDLQSGPRLVQTLTLSGHGGFRLWNDCVTAFQGSSVALYSLVTGDLLSKLQGHTKRLKCIDFVDDQVVTIADDRTLKLWQNGCCVRTMELPPVVFYSYSVDMTMLQAARNRVLLSTGDAIYAADF